jgi:hypothetical protein
MAHAGAIFWKYLNLGMLISISKAVTSYRDTCIPHRNLGTLWITYDAELNN